MAQRRHSSVVATNKRMSATRKRIVAPNDRLSPSPASWPGANDQYHRPSAPRRPRGSTINQTPPPTQIAPAASSTIAKEIVTLFSILRTQPSTRQGRAMPPSPKSARIPPFADGAAWMHIPHSTCHSFSLWTFWRRLGRLRATMGATKAVPMDSTAVTSQQQSPLRTPYTER